MNEKFELSISNAAKNALEQTQKIIDVTGPRLPGSENCHIAAKILEGQMKKTCDHVDTQEFNHSPSSLLDWIRILVVLYLVSIISLWFMLPEISLVLILLGFVIMIFEFFLYMEVIDFFFPKKKGINVIGTIEPEREVKKQIIISGHHDSAYVFNFLYKHPEWYSFRIFGGIGSYIFILLYSLVFTILKYVLNFDKTSIPLGIIAANIAFSVLFLLVGQLWFFRGNKGTPGAGDNLISSNIAIEVGKFFKNRKQQQNGLKNTRLIIASWDAEEAGLRGARAYVKKNLNKLLEFPTYNLNIDCPYNLKDLFFLTSDINGYIKLSQEMADQCVKITKTLGYDAKTKPIEFLTGATDAAEFGRYNIKATTLIGMPWGNQQRAAVYHTPNDTIDAIEPELVDICIEIAKNFVESIDIL